MIVSGGKNAPSDSDVFPFASLSCQQCRTGEQNTQFVGTQGVCSDRVEPEFIITFLSFSLLPLGFQMKVIAVLAVVLLMCAFVHSAEVASENEIETVRLLSCFLCSVFPLLTDVNLCIQPHTDHR
jgi:hypothetical protein